MQIAFYKAKGGFLNRAVRFFSKSPYSHCELIFEPPTVPTASLSSPRMAYCWSSSYKDGGVRFKMIDLDPKKWDLVKVRTTAQQAESIFRLCQSKVGLSYGTGDVLRFAIPGFRSKNNKFFCSEACLTVLQAHLKLLGARPDKTKPADLHTIVTVAAGSSIIQ